MHDESKTKAQLVSELKGLRRRVADLEALETESEKAVKVLRERGEFFHAFMENNPAVMYLKNNEGRHIYGNQTLFKYFNFKPDSFIGTTNYDIFPSEIADHLYEVDRIVRAEKKVVELKEWCDIRGDEERWWKEIKFPVQSNKGEIFVGGIALNITELKQAEENNKKTTEIRKIDIAAFREIHQFES
jgi:PAS domain S-box-containing protein